MRLRPTAAPGHINRKAREFEDEIAQLRSQGYTLSAIQESLAAVGVQVSLSAVWREVCRARRGSPKPKPQCAGLITVRAEPSETPPESPVGIPAPASGPASASSVADRRSGKDIAEEFRRSQTTNHLLRAKEQR